MSEYIVETLDVRITKHDKQGFDVQRVEMSADVKGEIVRCKDCKFFDTRKCKSQWPFNLNGFCAWGERRDE